MALTDAPKIVPKRKTIACKPRFLLSDCTSSSSFNFVVA